LFGSECDSWDRCGRVKFRRRDGEGGIDLKQSIHASTQYMGACLGREISSGDSCSALVGGGGGGG